jgi:hypothetical protein
MKLDERKVLVVSKVSMGVLSDIESWRAANFLVRQQCRRPSTKPPTCKI